MTLLLLDAPSLYFRAFYGVRPRAAADGTPVNAAYGFVDWVASLVRTREPGRLACAMDADWRPAFRVERLPSYKAHRVAEGNEPDELSAQVPIIVDVMHAAGVCVVEAQGYEADDVIATLAHTEPGPVEIVTGDRDLFQLVRDPHVRVLYPQKGVRLLEVVDESWIAARYGIPGRSYADYAILRGDASDGLPGVRGIGEKTAAGLIARYGSLDAVLEAAHTTRAGALGKVAASLDYLAAARDVVMLPTSLSLTVPDLTRPRSPADPDKLLELARRYALAGPIQRLVAALGSLPEGEPATPAPVDDPPPAQ